MRMRISVNLAVITILFQHFQILEVGGYPVTLGFLAGVGLVCALARTIPFVPVTLTAAIFMALTGITALMNVSVPSEGYFGTMALFLVTILILGFAFGDFRSEIVGSASFANAILACLAILVALAAGQVALGTLGSDVLFNVFGEHQYLRQYDPQLGMVQFPRAHALYLEPSYAAFVIGTLGVALINFNRHRMLAVALAVTGMVACQSTIGLLLVVTIFVLIAMRSRPAVVLVMVAALVTILYFSGEYLAIRLATINQDGSSAYYRIVAPLDVLIDVLRNNPLGMTLGSVESVVGTYGLQMAGVHATSLDNGIYVVVFYFGWLGVVALVVGLAVMARSVFIRLRTRSDYSWITPIWIGASLLFSGAIMAPEFAVMTWFVLVTFRLATQLNGTEVCVPQASTKYRHRHVSRSGWARAHP